MIQQMKEQYSTSKNLEARMSIYQYSIVPETLSQWLAKQIVQGHHLRILELGCGTGELWKELLGSFPDCDILLSDLSEGMLKKSTENLGEDAFKYEIIDFHRIPYPERTFDIVISNHNLYHALDLNQVLGEISRVLKDNGIFYSTTNSKEHLSGMRELIDFPDDLTWPRSSWTSEFDAETGAEVLSTHFSLVERRLYTNELHIKNFAPIIAYFRSIGNNRVRQLAEQSVSKMQDRFEVAIRQNGFLAVDIRACLFIGHK